MDSLDKILAQIETWGHEECELFLVKNAKDHISSKSNSIWSLRQRCKNIVSIEFTQRLKLP